MKVSELIELLRKENPESEVILQEDAEGNGYSPLAEVDGNALYLAETTYSGTVYPFGYEMDMDEDEWLEIKDKLHPCVLLSPIN